MIETTTHIKTDKQLVPALRFKEFDGEWELLRLGQIGSFKNGLNKDKKDFGFGSPFVNLMDVFGKAILENDEFGLVNANEKDLELYNLLKGDVLFIRSSVKRTGVGETSLVSKDYKNTVYSGFLIRFRANEENIGFSFRRYCFSNQPFRKELLSFATSSANTNINQESLTKIKVNFPSLPEQQKIASFLSAVDEKIQQLTKKKELLKDYKKGVMQQLFSSQLRFKDENGNPYPDWEEKRLGVLSEIVGGGTPETAKEEYWGGEVQWFTPTEIRSRFISDSVRTITQAGLKKSSAKLLPVGTILFTSRATIAELGFAMNECTTNQGFQSLIVNEKNNSEFIYYLIKKNKKEFIRKSQGSTFLEISSKEMKKMKFNIPCLEEQQKIATYLSSIDTKIERVNNQITQTQNFKKRLLQQMLI